MLNKRNDPIPAKVAIRLAVAFEKFVKSRFRNLHDLEAQAEKSLHSAVSLHSDVKLVEQLDKETGRAVKIWQTSQGPELSKYDTELREAELSFRQWLNDESGPGAYVQHPRTGEWRQIDRREWTKGNNLPPGVHDDFVSPDDMSSHGPSDAQIDGVLLKVFFDKNEFEGKLARLVGGVRRGKKPKYNWAAAKAEAWRLREYHGPFSPDDPDWDCQVRLVEAITKYFEQELGPDFELCAEVGDGMKG